MNMTQKKATIEGLIDVVLSYEQQHERVTDLRIGLGYTAVKLESGACGLACTLRYRLDLGGCSLLSQAGMMTGFEAAEAIPLLRSHNMLEAAVGLAAMNAVIAAGFPQAGKRERAPISELLRVTAQDRVGMVGYIGPIVKELQQCAREVIVFDEAKIASTNSGQAEISKITATEQQARLLPQCDRVILSATSLLNKTFDSLVEMALKAREICVMGPSTPMLPDVFRARNVTLLAGRQILDAQKVLQIVSEAGGTKSFSKVTEKIYLHVK